MELNIGIKKALITRISCELAEKGEEKTIDINITGNYLTAQNRVVSEFYFNSYSWSDKAKIEVPQEIKDQLQTIFLALTPIVYHKVNNMYKALPEIANVEQPAHKVEEEPNIDPEDIPF